MLRNMIAVLCVISSSAYATGWSGTSTTYGNTTYHNFHSTGIQVLPPAQPYYQDNGAAIAGGIVAGVALGALICKAFQPKQPVYNSYNYIYNHHTHRYEYMGR